MNIKRTLVISTILTLLLGTAAITSAATETLTIGFIGDSEGRNAENDQQLFQAAVLAAEQINAGDDDDVEGINGPNNTRYDLEIVYYEANTAEEAIDVFNEAVGEDMIAILGPHKEEWAQAIVDEGTPDVPIILGTADSPTGTRVFRAAAGYEAWAKAAADYLANERQFTNIALVTSNTSVAQDGRKAFKEVVDDDQIVVDLVREAEADDFADEAREIRDANADAVFAWVLDAQMISLLEDLRNVGWDGVIVYAGLDADFVEQAGSDLTDAVIGLTGWSFGAYDAETEAFVADYQTRWEQTPVDAAAAYYDAVFMLAAAIEKAGDSPSSVANQLNTLNYEGVQGSYEHTGTDSVMIIQASEDGQFIEAAHYADDGCLNCPDIWWVDSSDDDVANIETFNIGLIAAVDGAAQPTGENIEQAARLAAREINEAGGIVRNNIRYTLNLNVYSATDAEEAKTAFEQAIDDGMQLILGPDSNAQTLTNLTAADNAGVPQLTSATSSLTAAADSVFQVRSTDEALVSALAEYLLNSRDFTALGSVAVRTDYGLDTADTFANIVTDSDDGQLVLRLEHEVDQTDLTDFAQQIVDSNVQALAVWSTQPAAMSLLTALESMGWDGVFAYGYVTQDFAARLPADSSVEVIGSVNWWSSAGDWTSQDFAERYSNRYGDVATSQSAAYYDAIYLIASALKEFGSTSANIQSWLADVDSFIGVQGTYDPASYNNGELTRSVLIIGSDGHELARYDGNLCIVGCGE